VASLINALKPFKPAEINLMAVHPVFSAPAAERLRSFMEEGLLRHVVVTDTVACSKECIIPNLEVVPSTELSARVIKTIMNNDSMAKLLRDFNAEKYLSSPNLFNQ
jgi:ribose-phosphate pyrophosphokinase